MAAPCTRVLGLVKKGVHLVSGGLLWTPGCQRTASPLCLRLLAAHCRPLHLSSGPTLSSAGTKTDQQQRTEPQKTTDTQNDNKKAKEEEEEYDEGPEYIPQRKGKNPMMKIGYAWMIGLPSGIIGFLLVKRQVDKNRLKQLKVRQRIKKSNEGEYEGSRYRHHQSQSNSPP